MIANVSALVADLRARAASGKPVKVGIVGVGQMGTDLIVQLNRMPGLRLGAIAVRNVGNAVGVAAANGYSRDAIVEATTASTIDGAIERGLLPITGDVGALAAAGHIDVLIDATGNPNTGTMIALEAIRHGKHIVMMNVEADITIGRYLHAEARAAGIVYTGAAGDEPAAAIELIGFAQSLGLEIVCAGKGKNNPLKFDAVPADYEEEARARNMNPRMLVEFIDGSKTMVEMVAIANATGLVPDRPGMHGPAATRDTLSEILIPEKDGGVLSGTQRVDYSTGKGVAPGVFCVVKSDHPRIIERMADLKVGKGPYFTLFRPYHLTSMEAPLSAARAVLYGTADMVPLAHPVAEAVPLAKRDLRVGETLGKIGETEYRAWAVTYEKGQSDDAIPLGLAEGAQVIKPIKAGASITYDNCLPDSSLLVTQIRHKLDKRSGNLMAAE
jgi:predicted homoserine dehydrogenase-like protein